MHCLWSECVTWIHCALSHASSNFSRWLDQKCNHQKQRRHRIGGPIPFRPAASIPTENREPAVENTDLLPALARFWFSSSLRRTVCSLSFQDFQRLRPHLRQPQRGVEHDVRAAAHAIEIAPVDVAVVADPLIVVGPIKRLIFDPKDDVHGIIGEGSRSKFVGGEIHLKDKNRLIPHHSRRRDYHIMREEDMHNCSGVNIRVHPKDIGIALQTDVATPGFNMADAVNFLEENFGKFLKWMEENQKSKSDEKEAVSNHAALITILNHGHADFSEKCHVASHVLTSVLTPIKTDDSSVTASKGNKKSSIDELIDSYSEYSSENDVPGEEEVQVMEQIAEKDKRLEETLAELKDAKASFFI
ncbi:hypothetical protein DH2020_019339 [Rehmannia glutinosa]|uniref:Uncharacterized protein n=1 Tax=Rehmannia glutinosa TaxID=99300 RepID=A0ABR0WLL9_REHGL